MAGRGVHRWIPPCVFRSSSRIAGVFLPGGVQSRHTLAPIGSVRVALSKAFNTNDVKVGDVFHLHSPEPLQTPGCILAPNTEIVGRVELISRLLNAQAGSLWRFASTRSSVTAIREDRAFSTRSDAESLCPGESRTCADLHGSVSVPGTASRTMIGSAPNNDVMLATREAMSAGTREDKPLMAGQVEGIQGLHLWLRR